MKTITISKETDLSQPVKVKYCDAFFDKLLGLMFKKTLGFDEGIVLVESNESRLNAAIHMLFMNFDLAILWLDQDLVIVDKMLAKKWHPFYIPNKPAKYIVEVHPSLLGSYAIGEKMIFHEMQI